MFLRLTGARGKSGFTSGPVLYSGPRVSAGEGAVQALHLRRRRGLHAVFADLEGRRLALIAETARELWPREAEAAARTDKHFAWLRDTYKM